MAKSHSSNALATDTPKFWLHKASGYLVIKRKGKLYYLGKTEEQAQDRYLRHRHNIDKGKPIPSIEDDLEQAEFLTLEDVCTHFLNRQTERMNNGDISRRSYFDYKRTCERLQDHIGRAMPAAELGPEDFASYSTWIATKRNPIGVGNEITRIKTVFKWAYEAEHLDRPMRFGPDFKRPSKRVIRAHKFSKGKKLFTAEQIHGLLDDVNVHLRAMVYLGINCGFGNSDCGNLPTRAVDLDAGVIDWLRHKTGEPRRCVLWPETVEALRLSLSRRTDPITEEAKDKFFVTPKGDVWASDDEQKNLITVRITQALHRTKLHSLSMGFYWLRHTFRTVADEIRDDPAINLIMGHSDETIQANYRHEISDDRLRAVSDHVRAWLFGEESK